jgi:hypothetical protein
VTFGYGYRVPDPTGTGTSMIFYPRMVMGMTGLVVGIMIYINHKE